MILCWPTQEFCDLTEESLARADTAKDMELAATSGKIVYTDQWSEFVSWPRLDIICEVTGKQDSGVLYKYIYRYIQVYLSCACEDDACLPKFPDVLVCCMQYPNG